MRLSNWRHTQGRHRLVLQVLLASTVAGAGPGIQLRAELLAAKNDQQPEPPGVRNRTPLRSVNGPIINSRPPPQQELAVQAIAGWGSQDAKPGAGHRRRQVRSAVADLETLLRDSNGRRPASQGHDRGHHRGQGHAKRNAHQLHPVGDDQSGAVSNKVPDAHDHTPQTLTRI